MPANWRLTFPTTMLGVMTRVNKLLIIFLGFAYSVAVASSGHHVLKQLSHSKPPHVATAHGLSVAVVFPTEGIAQLIVLRSDSVEARSAAFATSLKWAVHINLYALNIIS